MPILNDDPIEFRHCYEIMKHTVSLGPFPLSIDTVTNPLISNITARATFMKIRLEPSVASILLW